MGTREKQAQLKVYYDQKKKKVMFAEAQEDFVDILLSFFVLPLGTITKLSRKHVDLNDIKVGSLTSLYESVVNLNENHFSDNQFYGFYHKDLLVNQRNWLPSNWPEPKESLDKKMPQKEGIHIPLFGASPLFGTSPLFVKNKSNFIITEDLNVLPVKLDTSIVLLKSLGIENINLLEERTMSFGFEEFLNLLIWSLLTNNPLTNLVFGGSKQSTSCINNSNLNHIAFISSNSGQSQTVKLVIQKSKKKLLCAQVEKFFVELLFSFLTIPLGAFLHLTKDNLSPLGITNLYNSTSCLGDGEYLKSKNVKNKLLCPKVNVASYPCVTNLLPIYPSDSRPGSFLKEPATFIVYDNLEVINASSIDIISKLNTLGVSVGDMEVVDVSIGEKEALLLLKSSLTSTSALTDFLNTLC